MFYMAEITFVYSLILRMNFINMTIEADRYLSEMPEDGKPPEKNVEAAAS